MMKHWASITGMVVTLALLPFLAGCSTDENKMLFLYGGGEFKCARGGWTTGELLIAIYGKGSPPARAGIS